MRLIALSCTAVCAPATFAQSADPQLKEMVVTASRNSQLLADALPHTTVLNARDIALSQATDVVSLLDKEAGIQITQSGGRGGASSIFVRGAASVQVLVLIDGVPITKQDASGSVSLEHLMTDQIERIEIVRGNVSAIYGTGAVGGVVQLFTKQKGGAPSLSMTTEIGSRGSSKVSLGASGSFGAEGSTRVSAGLSTNRTKGFSAINAAQLPDANPDADGYRNQNWSLSLAHDLARGHTVGLRTTHSDGKFDFDSSFDAPVDLHKGRTQVSATTLFTENHFTQDWLSKLSWSSSSDRNTNEYTTAFPVTNSFTSKNRVLNWTNKIAFGQAVFVTAGAEQQRQAADVDDGFGGLYARDRSVNALFAGLEAQLGSHALQLNLRRDNVPVAGNETTGYLGYAYTVTPQWKFSASTSTAFNIAPLGYLYDPNFGNPALLPEKAKSHELGLQYANTNQVLRATYFSTRSRDLFEYDFASNTFQNVARTKNTGLEVSYSGKVGMADVRASLTAQKPVDENTGLTLNRRAKSLAALSVNQPIGAWRLGANLRYSGTRTDGTQELAAYTLVDVSARYQFAPGLEAFGRVENLGNKQYQTVYGYNQAPRGVFVGLQWQPKL